MHIAMVTGFFPNARMGGAEHQTYTIASGLAARGHRVTFIAAQAETPATYQSDGVNVCELPARDRVGVEVHAQLLRQALKDCAAEACYNCVFAELAFVAPVCRELGIPVISTSCSEDEATPVLLGHHPTEAVRYVRSRKTFHHWNSFREIRNSAAHMCVSNSIRARLEKRFPQLPMRTIYNGQTIPSPDEIHLPSSGQIIWVNNLKRLKRPQLFVDLAKQLPQYRFLMVGRPPEGRFKAVMDRRLQSAPENFQYVGAKPIDETNDLIRQSDLLLYTSLPIEGFGNSFVQAWLRGVPTVSLENRTDEIPIKQEIGRCPQTFAQLSHDVCELMEDEPLRCEMGLRARKYAEVHHSVDRMVDQHEQLFLDITRQQAA